LGRKRVQNRPLTKSATTVKLDAETKQRVQRLASEKQRSTHWLMREAIEQYVTREEQRSRLRHDVVAAWERYEATGLHVPAEEADAWLAKLEAGEDAEPPACHD
jgi:predicted transcriptional regulator